MKAIKSHNKSSAKAPEKTLDISGALEIQQRLLPKKLPDTEDFSFSIRYTENNLTPGMGYNTIRLDDDEVAFYAFNIFGSPLGAAYFSAMSHMAFSHHLMPDKPPSATLRDINTSLVKHLRSLEYLTAFLGILDLRCNVLKYCNAHYGPACRLNKRTGELEPLNTGGGFIGVMHDFDFKEGHVQLCTGDVVTLLLSTNTPDKIAGFPIIEKLVKAHEANTKNIKHVDSIASTHALLSFEVRLPPRKALYLKTCGMDESANLHIKTLHDFDEMKEHIRYLLSEADKIGYPLRFQKNFRLVLLELITNAIIHGNKYNREKKCVVLTDMSPQKIDLGVIDEGEGYDIKTVPDPLHPENINKPHGRGLFIIKHYVDDFRLQGNGNSTVVTFNRTKE